jgi:hypothetical protein
MASDLLIDGRNNPVARKRNGEYALGIKMKVAERKQKES